MKTTLLCEIRRYAMPDTTGGRYTNMFCMNNICGSNIEYLGPHGRNQHSRYFSIFYRSRISAPNTRRIPVSSMAGVGGHPGI